MHLSGKLAKNGMATPPVALAPPFSGWEILIPSLKRVNVYKFTHDCTFPFILKREDACYILDF